MSNIKKLRTSQTGRYTTKDGKKIRCLPGVRTPPPGPQIIFHPENVCPPIDRLYIGDGLVVNDTLMKKLIVYLSNLWLTKARGFTGMIALEYEHRPDWMKVPFTDRETERLTANFVCFQAKAVRSGKASSTILRDLCRIYVENPEYFDPKNKLENTRVFRDLIAKFDPQTDFKAEFGVTSCLYELEDPASDLPIQDQPGVMEKVIGAFETWKQEHEEEILTWWKSENKDVDVLPKMEYKNYLYFYNRQEKKPILVLGFLLMQELWYRRHDATIRKTWVDFFRTLREDYSSNALYLVLDPKDTLRESHGSFYDHVMGTDFTHDYEMIDPLRLRIGNHLRSFYNIEWKIASMFILFFQKVEWSTQPEFWERFNRIPVVPVDLHHLRILPDMGVIYEYVNDRRDLISSTISHYLAKLCF
jgi:hypothetical protein